MKDSQDIANQKLRFTTSKKERNQIREVLERARLGKKKSGETSPQFNLMKLTEYTKSKAGKRK